MIFLANSESKAVVQDMWQICFADTPEFVEMYFSEKYQPENTLLYSADGQIVASLQMLPYTFSFYGREILAAYVSGACTLPEYRGRGIMGELLQAAFATMQERNIPLSVLIPAEDWLYGYYARCGYATVFEKDDEVIPLKEIVEATDQDIDRAYRLFDAVYRGRNLCVQKSRTDFNVIVKDAEMDGFPPKTNVAGMARIIDAGFMLSLYAKAYKGEEFIIDVEDKDIETNNAVFRVSAGKCERLFSPFAGSAYKVDVATLCSLLFGFHIESVKNEATRYFENQHPVMNLMLE